MAIEESTLPNDPNDQNYLIEAMLTQNASFLTLLIISPNKIKGKRRIDPNKFIVSEHKTLKKKYKKYIGFTVLNLILQEV